MKYQWSESSQAALGAGRAWKVTAGLVSVRPQMLMNKDRVKVRPAKLCEGLIHRATRGKL